MSGKVNLLFIGDIVGSIGRKIVKDLLPKLREEYSIDLVIANGENTAHGSGITEKIYNELIGYGIDGFTMGNHVWDKKDIMKNIEKFPNMVRPANYPPGTVGKDSLILTCKNGVRVGIINVSGRVFMPPLDCPFRVTEAKVAEIKNDVGAILVDIHAEATSEKAALGWFLDGKVSAVVGTHTHVMTADEKILTQGTAYITDAGMTGARDSVIGVKKEPIIKKFLTSVPEKFEPPEKGVAIFNAVVIEIEDGLAKKITRVVEVREY